jgi:peptide/nickel transport system permease protein
VTLAGRSGQGRSSAAVVAPARIRARSWWRLARSNPTGAAGAAILIVMAALAIAAPWVSPFNPVAADFGAMLQAPSRTHPLGSDAFGRDVASRLIYGARTALAVGFGASILGATAGAAIGVVGAYFGGRTDLVMQRLIDILISFPIIIVAMAIVAIVGAGMDKLVIAIALSFVPRAARVVRSSALAVRSMTYIEAAHALGGSPWRIMSRHMAPNVAAPYLVMLTAFLGQAILLEASLSFLGLGATEPTPAWGLMLRGAAVDFVQRAPWMAVFPGLAISAAVLAFNLLGDTLRDALDPRLRGAGP